MSKNPPEGFEILPPAFLSAHGAQPDMRYAHDDSWVAWNPFHTLSAVHIESLVFAGRIGTIAAATTPLPGRECDCGLEHNPHWKHSPSCSIHRTYRHILPAALAALPEKPEGLMWYHPRSSQGWQRSDYVWPFCLQDETGEIAYAIPAQSGTGKLRFVSDCNGDGTEGTPCPNCHSLNPCDCLTRRPLSTQPEGGEECAHQTKNSNEVKNQPEDLGPMLPQLSTRASNAAPANVPTVAGSGQRETPRTDAEWGKAVAGHLPPHPPAATAMHWYKVAAQIRDHARDLERQLAEAKAKFGVWSEEELRMAEARAAEAQATFWNDQRQLKEELSALRARLAALKE